jgi:LemA protein
MGKGGKIGLGCLALVLIAVFIIASWIWSSYNGLVKLDENVNQSWAQVQNVYQRRFDLIPNLVETVKGYAAHERETFKAVTEARSKVGGVMQLDAKDLTPENLAKFNEAQAGLSGALQRMMVVVEQYPVLKANENFIRLQDELAGTENRIAQERMRFNQAAQEFNQTIRRFPQVMIANMLGFKYRAYFEGVTQAQEAPKVQF